MQLSHSSAATSVTFDDPNLVSAAGLVPAVQLAADVGLRELADKQLTVPTDKGANAGLKVASLVAGMVAGADSIDDLALLRHGGTGKVFTGRYAPSTLGSFLRSFTFGHVRQLDAVTSRVLIGLSCKAPLPVRTPASTCALMSMTRSSRFTATRSRAPAMGTRGRAGSTCCWPPPPPAAAHR